MSFKEWLYDQLVTDGIIDDSTELEELTESMLFEDTEVDSYDIENYKEQFLEHCSAIGASPVWDVD